MAESDRAAVAVHEGTKRAETSHDDGAGPSTADNPDGRHCGFCGSRVLRASRRTGLREEAFKLLGATVYRCGRRFAFALMRRRPRHRRHDCGNGGNRLGLRRDDSSRSTE